MEPETLSVWLLDFVADMVGFRAYLTILLALLAGGIGVPLPEDITLFIAGIMAYQGRIWLPGAFWVGFFGVLGADNLLYLMGRFFGRRMLTWPMFRRVLTPERMQKAENRIRNKAPVICFTVRFMPGMRAPVYLTAGILRVSWPVFIVMDGLAALISVPVWVYLAYYLGGELEQLLSIVGRAKFGFIGLLILLALVYLSRRWKRRRSV
jgi:membrane protein DedA with SNARE-associated domain